MVPVNTNFYTFDVNGAVTGFAQRVITTPSLLRPYNAIDLSYRVIAGYDSDLGSMFETNVFNV
jgi:hypothetical protein